MNGFGLFAYINGNTYTGQFVGDCKHGHGRFLWANGDAYDGEFFVYVKLFKQTKEREFVGDSSFGFG